MPVMRLTRSDLGWAGARPGLHPLLLISTGFFLLLAGCSRETDRFAVAPAVVEERFENLARALDETQREQAAQQARIQSLRRDLAALRADVLPGSPGRQMAEVPGTALPATASPAAVENPERQRAGGRFLRNFAILCFTGFLIVQAAKIYRKRHQPPIYPEDAPESGQTTPKSAGSTVFYSASDSDAGEKKESGAPPEDFAAYRPFAGETAEGETPAPMNNEPGDLPAEESPRGQTIITTLPEEERIGEGEEAVRVEPAEAPAPIQDQNPEEISRAQGEANEVEQTAPLVAEPGQMEEPAAPAEKGEDLPPRGPSAPQSVQKKKRRR